MECRNISIDSAAGLVIHSGFDLSIYGNMILFNGSFLTNYGSIYLKQDFSNFNHTATTFDSGYFVFSGIALQRISGSDIFGKLTINNSLGVGLSSSVQVAKLLTLSNGLLWLSNSDLLLAANAKVSGTFSATSMVDATGSGAFRKVFSSPDSFIFPVGGADYSPVKLKFTSGTFAAGAYASVRLVNSKYPDPNITDNYINRFWVVSQNGITSFHCNATFNYADADISGHDSLIYCSRFLAAPVKDFNKADTVTNELTANGLSEFGTFTGTMENYKKLNLTLFLEGLYTGSGSMYPAYDDSAPHWGSTVADMIEVKLHDSANYANIIFNENNVSLGTNGLATVMVPAYLKSHYYISIQHRNSIETVTANPVAFPGRSVVNYNFSTSANKAFGNNLKGIAGVYVIFSGDVSSSGVGYPAAAVQDGITDLEDLYYIFYSYLNGDTGYLAADLNGDGVVDITDEYLAFDNFLLGVYAITP